MCTGDELGYWTGSMVIRKNKLSRKRGVSTSSEKVPTLVPFNAATRQAPCSVQHWELSNGGHCYQCF